MNLDLVAAEVISRSDLKLASATRNADRIIVSGCAFVAGRSVKLEVVLDGSLASEFPEVVLLERARYGHLAHVNSSGVVCIGRREAMVPDMERPVDVVLAALHAAQLVLERSFTCLNASAFVDEFEAYWRDLKDATRIEGYVSPTGPPRRLWVQKTSKNNHMPRIVADSVESFTRYHPKQPWCGNHHNRGLFIPLAQGTRVLPPLPGDQVSESYLRGFLDYVVSPRPGTPGSSDLRS